MKTQVFGCLAIILLSIALFGAINTSQATDATLKTRIVDAIGDNGGYASLAVDNNGYPHISYYDSINADLKYASFDGKDWKIATVDSTGDVGGFTSLVLDSTDTPHICYLDKTNGALKYVYFDGSSWHLQTVDSSVTFETVSLALDANGYPCISYCGAKYDLMFARWNGTSWTTRTIDSVGTTGLFSSLAFDASGNAHIAYMDFTNKELEYAKFTTSWSIRTVDSDGDVGRCASLAVSNDGNPCISYTDILRNELRLANWTGSAWNKQVVDSSASSYNSLVLDSSGNPCIAYLGTNSLGLKYAKSTGSSWTSQIISSSSQSPYDRGQVSLALTYSNYPYIAYFDSTSNHLMCASLIPTYTITFAQVGATNYTGTLLTVDQADYTPAELPVSFVWDHDTKHSFTFASPITTSNGSIVWSSTSGLSSLQSGNLTISDQGTILATYQTQPTTEPTPEGTANPTNMPTAIPTAQSTTIETPIVNNDNTMIIAIAVAAIVIALVITVLFLKMRRSQKLPPPPP